MNIILSGYGKMGREVGKTAVDRGHTIAAIIARPEEWAKISHFKGSDCVVIDFSLPSSAVVNIRHCFDNGLPVVIGTTGWYDRLEEVKKWVESENQSLFIGSNFSIGVNIMFEISKVLAGLLNTTDGYEIKLEETHHIHKVDSPSGTAISLAQLIIDNYKNKKNWVNRPSSSPEELEIISRREGEIPGIHTITCESVQDRLMIRHEAKGRAGFATGAVMAAEWLPGRKGIFQMRDMLRTGG